MRRVLVGVCWVSAILTGVALVPGAIVLGLFVVVVPGLVLIAAPYLFAASLASLIAVTLFGHLGFAARMCAYAGFALLLLGLATAASWQINRPLMREWETLSAGDHPWNGTKDGIGAIALLQNRAAADGGNPALCFSLCQRLLYTGTAESVLQGASPADTDSSSIDPAQPVIRYRVEKRGSCPPVTLPDGEIRQSELNIFNNRQLLDDVKIRIAEGNCLIAETVTLAQSDLVVVNEVLRKGHQPNMRDRWTPALDTLSARRLAIYRIRDGRAVQLSRETSMTAYPVRTPLLIGLLTGDPIDIEFGILQVPKKNPGDDIGAFFEKVFGLKAVPVGARATIASGSMPRLLDEPANASTDQSMGEIERLLRAALADPTLPANSPKLMLANTYFESIARNRRGDVALLAGLISDRRVTDVSDALRRAVIALGPASAPLAGPLLNRIDAEIPGGQPRFIQELSVSFNALPPGAAIRVMPHLESLARDKQRRERAYRILPRLADKGPASLADFLEFIEAGPSEHAPLGPREPGDPLLRAGISGLCQLGPAAASAGPILFAKLEAYRNADNLGEIERAEVEALVHMGREQELAQFFTQPRLVRLVTNQSRVAATVSCRAF
jgi:hypothetical protein